MDLFLSQRTALAGLLLLGAGAAHRLHQHDQHPSRFIQNHNDHNDHRHHHKNRDLESFHRCGTEEGTDDSRLEQMRALEQYQHWSSTNRTNMQDEAITIPVCFHVIQGEGVPMYSNYAFQTQVDMLNRAFGGGSCCDNEAFDWCTENSCSSETGLRFAWAKVDVNGTVVDGATVDDVDDPDACFFRIDNSNWTSLSARGAAGYDPITWEMKAMLHKGDAKVLNTYWTTTEGFLGYAQFPWRYEIAPVLDGIVMLPDTLPGGLNERFNEGDTLVHEVGYVRGARNGPFSCDW
jgi:hypothetical protein